MSSTDTARTAAVALRSRLLGAVVEPGDAAWDQARQAFNLTVDQQPAVIAFPRDEQDVVAAVQTARELGLRVSAQRSGHGAGPLASRADDVLLLKTDALQGVEIDAPGRRARVAAGATWANVVPVASELGLAALHGSAPDVSVVGYSLGGGMGWYARKLGLAANSVTAIEVVTADGELVRADRDHEPELFWALRGGGGNFGVVTALEFALYPVEAVYAGALFFPWERTGEVLQAWREWTALVPDEVTSVGRILQLPPLDFLPAELRGRSFVMVEAAGLLGEAEGRELLEPLRVLGPEMDTFALVSPAGLADLHMDPPEPIPYRGAHALLGELPAAGIDALVAAAGPGSGSQLVTLEVRQTGGELARTREHHGALSTLPGSFCWYSAGIAADAASLAATEDQLAAVSAALEPYAAGRYGNFVEEAVDTASFFAADTYSHLQAVKAAYDPDDLFRANHPIPPAA